MNERRRGRKYMWGLMEQLHVHCKVGRKWERGRRKANKLYRVSQCYDQQSTLRTLGVDFGWLRERENLNEEELVREEDKMGGTD